MLEVDDRTGQMRKQGRKIGSDQLCFSRRDHLSPQCATSATFPDPSIAVGDFHLLAPVSTSIRLPSPSSSRPSPTSPSASSRTIGTRSAMQLRPVLLALAVLLSAAILVFAVGDVEHDEPELTLLNNDKETRYTSPKKRTSTQDVIDKEIDRMPHRKESTQPPALPVKPAHPFDEFTFENDNGKNDPIAKSSLTSAISILANRRQAKYTDDDIRSAYMDLEAAAEAGNNEAKKLLAFADLFGEHRWSVDEALNHFKDLVVRGSVDGHLGLALIYFTGVTLPKPNRARGLVHLQLAAQGGNPMAQMALGYRQLLGVDMKPNCERALKWYKIVATKVASKVTFLGGTSMQKLRIPEEVESASSSVMDANVFTYYKYLAENGDVQAILGLGNLYLTGSKGVPIDYNAALKYYSIAAESGNPMGMAVLGKMYYDGTDATPVDDELALTYFKKAADKGNSYGQVGLALMLLNGRGVRKDPIKAMRLFATAAEQSNAEGQFYLGYMHYRGFGSLRDHKSALRYFQVASQSGNLLAIYNLAQMHAQGIGTTRNCQLAVQLYKTVAERGRWGDRFMEAFNKFHDGAVDEAAFNYMLLGELGYEIAQTNFAYLIEENAETQQLFHTELEAYKWALVSWQRSANQQYAFARVKLGDFNFYGLGTKVDYSAALNHYKIAADDHNSAQAMFNLGYMHEQGLGLDKDLHLAKRYYDQASETATEALVPVALAMLKLRAVFLLDYMKENFVWHSALLVFLDSSLGSHWDVFVMSLLVGIIPYFVFQYWQNRRQAAAAAEVQPAPAQ
uniref:HCP-like protein n=1 Tax=Panagrellus redivivus TaxID=6233 RepID=A0A7E4W8N3_PANRE